MTSGKFTSKTAADGWWIVAQTVLPVSAILFIALMTTSAPRLSNPEVGSSGGIYDGKNK